MQTTVPALTLLSGQMVVPAQSPSTTTQDAGFFCLLTESHSRLTGTLLQESSALLLVNELDQLKKVKQGAPRETHLTRHLFNRTNIFPFSRRVPSGSLPPTHVSR
jgi:hypothetical protein